MSDFLSSLAARSVGAAPALAPRRASRFESAVAPAAASPAEAEPDAWGEASAEAPARRTPRIPAPEREASEPAGPHPIAAEMAASPRRAASPALGEPVSAPVAETRRRGRSDTAASPSPATTSGDEPAVASLARSPSPEPISVERSDRPAAERGMMVEPVRPAARAASPSPEAPAPIAAQETVIRGEASSTVVVRERETVREVTEARATAGSPPAPPRMPVIVPRIAPAPPQRAVTASSPSAAKGEAKEEAAPVIQVSIGRIEVRAAHPAGPAPTPRPAPAPRTTSLGDYLRNSTRRRP